MMDFLLFRLEQHLKPELRRRARTMIMQGRVEVRCPRVSVLPRTYKPRLISPSPARRGLNRIHQKHKTHAISFKIKEYGNVGRPSLDTAAEEALAALLSDQTFHDQLRIASKLPPEASVQFTGILFEPVPWSPSTPKGMPPVSYTVNLLIIN
jgi:hypothetical protein